MSATKPSGKAIANETRAASSPSDAWLSDMCKRFDSVVRHDKVKSIKSCSLPLFKLIKVYLKKDFIINVCINNFFHYVKNTNHIQTEQIIYFYGKSSI